MDELPLGQLNSHTLGREAQAASGFVLSSTLIVD